jgi:hypothetical protein
MQLRQGITKQFFELTKTISGLLRYLRFWGGTYRCIVCKRPLRSFFPFSTDLQQKAKEFGFKYEFSRMETLNINSCNCPFCLSSDRERLYLIFLENYFEQNKKPTYSILDFAPNAAFSKQLRDRPYVEYHSADLFRPDVDLRVDICDMKEIMDCRYDIIICSHVLEHVASPDVSMKELFRILRKDGIAIIMVPLFLDVDNTIEDVSHTSEEQRLKFYGQADHVRLFARHDFLARLKRVGFIVNEIIPSMLDAESIKRNAIAKNSVLYVCGRS